MKGRRSEILIICLGIIALILWLVSLYTPSERFKQKMQVNKVERALHKRQNLMEKYLHQVEQIPVNEWIDLEDFPEDMVLYRYNADTLQSWVNQFTISNDEVDVAPLWYRLHYMSNGNYHNSPLAYLTEKESYVNLGSGWYVLDVHTHGAVKIITGILIKSEYPTDRKVPAEIMNKRLKFGGSYVSSEIDANRGGIVYGIHGTPLFSVYRQTPSAGHGDGMMMRMMAILLALVALFIYHSTRRTARSMWITLLLLTLLYILSNYVGRSMEELSQFFSPLLYADDKLFGSLAELVFCNLYIYLFVRAVYMNRLVWYKMVRSASKRFRDTVSALCFIAIMVLVGYIYISLHSLITNSVIILELFRVTDITLYTAVSYISFSLLFLVLVYLLQMASTLSKGNRTVSFFSWKYLAAFVLAISTFTLITVSVVSDKKEIDNNRVLVNKLSVERDLNLEMELRKVENAIANDRIIATLSYWTEGGADVIRNRIQERYLSSAQNYDIGVTSCRSNTSLIIDAYTPAVECYDFFRNEIDTYGTPLAPGSSFFFMNNYQGKSSYIGVFSYFNYQNYQSARLFVELVPKYSISPIEELVLHQNVRNNSTVPSSYSYAKYVGGNLSTHTGEFNYPLRFSLESSGQAYKVERSNGMVHYIGVVADDVIIVLSRAQRGFFAYLISFSYLLFLYGTIAIILTRRYRKRSALSIPQHSFKRKITMLLVVSIVAALLCVGAGSVIYTVRRSGDNIQNQMFNRLDIVQSTLSEFCKYALRYNDINTPQLFDAMQRVANNTQSDINLYDVYGRLIRSTKPEFFEQYIMGSRINHNAFYHITIRKDSRYLGLERVAGQEYFSVYAPILNSDGTLVAIANIPFVSTSSSMQEDAILSVATIVNIYLLIIIFSMVIGIMIANSITSPLAQIKAKMLRFKLNNKEHIYYKNNKDELGVLVEAYNHMVDDLEESSRKLAESEREEAWREMARTIAHDIKNPLTPMRLSIQHIMRMKRNDAPGWQDKLDELSKSLLEQIDILSDAAGEFLALAKSFSDNMTREDLCAMLHEQYVLFNTRDDVTIEYEHSIDEAYAMVRKSQMIRVFVNIISNAVQAVEQKEGAIVRVSITAVDSNWKVAIEDNGEGVSDANVEKLFQPNFTTKSSGTGLGLMISQRVVNQANGKIYYQRSEALGGAAFIIELPMIQ